LLYAYGPSGWRSLVSALKYAWEFALLPIVGRHDGLGHFAQFRNGFEGCAEWNALPSNPKTFKRQMQLDSRSKPNGSEAEIVKNYSPFLTFRTVCNAPANPSFG